MTMAPATGSPPSRVVTVPVNRAPGARISSIQAPGIWSVA
jgi:hypothetical protein